MNVSLKLVFLIVLLFSRGALSQPVAPEKADGTTLTALKTVKDCDICPELVVIPEGTYLRGSKEGRSTEQPVHQVRVKSFLMGRTEVTQGQWKAVMDSTPSSNQACGESCPVDSVSWDDAQAFLKKLSEVAGKKYRLPSEAEWEYAARAGTTSAYWWGDVASHEQANYGSEECCDGLAEGRDKWEKTAPVGQFQPNAFGLHDMLGNVAEWVEDVYHKNYLFAPGDGSAWISGASYEFLARVVRGGAWTHDPGNIRSASRAMGIVVETSNSIGFRVVRAP